MTKPKTAPKKTTGNPGKIKTLPRAAIDDLIPDIKPITQDKMFPEGTEALSGEVVKSEAKKQAAGLAKLEQHTQPTTGDMVKAPSREAALSIVGGITTAELKAALAVQTEQRKLIQQFIKDNLVEGIDYGKIHVVKNCPAEEKWRGSCDRDYHFSKSILFKPGQEKIFSLFGITDELEKDEEAYNMMPNVTGLVAYKCIMYRGDVRVGEGGGAATLQGSQNDPNTCIKKARKRAKMDACLSLGFSAYFTQDLDDPEYASQREMMNSKAAAEAERRDKDEFGLMPRNADDPISGNEWMVLQKMVTGCGYQGRDEIVALLKVNGVEFNSITSGQAKDMMRKLKNNAFAAPVIPPKNLDVVVTDIEDQDPAAALDEAEAAMSAAPVPAEPELVVDDELKTQVALLGDSLGLNARGRMWLMQRIAGKPFGNFKAFTDEQWRKAFQVIQAIIDGAIKVEAGHLSADEDSTPAVDYSEPSIPPPVQELFPGSEQVTEVKPQKGVPANG